MGLPQSQILEEVFQAYHEQTARRAIQTLCTSRNPRLPSANQFKEYMLVYYFKRRPKLGSWHVAFVRKVQDHSLLLYSNELYRGPYIRAAYEDVRSVPKSAFLVELDQMGLVSPLSYSVLDKESEPLDSSGSHLSKDNRQEQTSSQDHDQP
ncbi:hypothetical protein BWQ96_06074 [Gracilariopsis chorda]|uniref:Uncharacterized protein n=1 Tax=Gracilariopsis chorda TaxID=448386 RepID=A0A2V3IQ01_9FLOR|nr:hypothetical protein BWQ96_06074 [Gracilariopsis chorda]|eukprot:PXF44165.1 hypothetical protein BWQ96_06074 [Gracilariopsis chorda]